MTLEELLMTLTDRRAELQEQRKSRHEHPSQTLRREARINEVERTINLIEEFKKEMEVDEAYHALGLEGSE